MTDTAPNRADDIRNRGRIYLEIFREISMRHGDAEAVAILRAASYGHGTEVGKDFAKYAPGDFDGMLKAWFGDGDGGATFAPHVHQRSETLLDVQQMRCPLKEGWLEAGCTPEEVGTLLYCATGFDHGVLTAAGFTYEIEPWSQGKPGCCRVRLFRPPGE